MASDESSLFTVVSNTGPLISAFQSNSLDLIVELFGIIHTSDACVAELARHDWQEAMAQFGSDIVSHKLTESEAVMASELANRIAAHSVSKDSEPSHHMGEAEVMVLAQRSEFRESILLLDELAARAVATEIGLNISGFAGMLLAAVGEGLLTAEEAKDRLQQCQAQGTHYSTTFVEQIYRTAREVQK